MNSVLEQDGLTAQFISEPTSWRVYSSKQLIGEFMKDEWANQDVDFVSEEAGHILLATLNELRAAFEDPNVSGIVEDIKDPTPAPKADSTPNEDQGTSPDIAKEVIKLMEEVLEEAETFGGRKEHVAALDELMAIYTKITG